MVRADPHSPQVTLGLGREHICQTPELRSPGAPGGEGFALAVHVRALSHRHVAPAQPRRGTLGCNEEHLPRREGC